MNLFFIQERLSRHFTSLGQLIARHPLYFVTFPILVSISLATGILQIRSNRHDEYLIMEENGAASKSRQFVNKFFPMNTSNLYNTARISENEIAIIQIIPKDKKSVFREEIIKDILSLDDIICNITITHSHRIFDYASLCGKTHGVCYKSTFFDLARQYKHILAGKYKVKYPIDLNNITFHYNEYVISLGGVSLDEEGYIKDARGVRLLYGFDLSDKNKTEAIRMWRTELTRSLKTVKFDTIFLTLFCKEATIDEIKKFTDEVLALIPFIAAILIIFSFFACLTNDCVRSKPWLGPAACISAGLALASGFGLISYIGIEYVDPVAVLLYSALALEIDDAFVLIAAWRKTSVSDTVEKRMGETLSQAGVSITITSITNIASFCVGLTLPLPLLRIFSAYGVASMFFTYAYQITFFSGCLALSGYREERRISPFTFRVVNNEESNDYNQIPVYEEWMMKQFREKVGYFLTLKPIKFVVIVIFFANLSVALFGLKYTEVGTGIFDAVSYDSPLRDYEEGLFGIFGCYSYPAHIIITQPMNYAEKHVQDSVENMLQMLEELPHVADSSLRMSWLKHYLMFTNLPFGRFMLRGYNISNKQDFIDGLRNVFFRLPQAEEFKQDVAFNENCTDIIASRFLLLTKDIYSQQIETGVIKDLTKVCESFPMRIKLFSINQRFLEQAIIVKGQTIQTAIITVSLICVVCFLFLPNIHYVCCVSIVVCCIIVEVVGYMSYWNVRLDFIFLGIFILCAGFSINYPTHITYSFAMAKKLKSNGRIKQSLYEMGLPVVQGSLSTVLGILLTALQPFYGTIASFEIIVLFACQTAFHSLFVIPVFLSVVHEFGHFFSKKFPRNEPSEEPSAEERFIQERKEDKL